MSSNERESPCHPDLLFELAAGRLPSSEAEEVLAHTDRCERCRKTLTTAQRIAGASTILRDPSVDDVTRARLWANLSDRGGMAAQRMKRRAAWRTILIHPPVVWAAAAGLVALVVGLILLVASGFRDSPLGAHDGSVQSTEDQKKGQARHSAGAGNRSMQSMQGQHKGVAHHSDDPASEMGTANGRLNRSPRYRRPGSRTAMSGLKRLACGAWLTLGKAKATILRDRADDAVVQLESGRILLTVPKLSRGARLKVVTSDAQVLVKGTRFSVHKQHGGATTVSVREGTVWIIPTGRNRQVLVLRAGNKRSVLGEGAFLQQLWRRIDAAVGAQNLGLAEQLCRRYLAVTRDPTRVIEVKLKLAAVSARLGRFKTAARLYRQVASGRGHATTRQNALALLAVLYQRRGSRAAELRTWKELLRRFPRGIHTREALIRLVRATCRKRTVDARSFRTTLSKRHPHDATTVKLLRACAPIKR